MVTGVNGEVAKIRPRFSRFLFCLNPPHARQMKSIEKNFLAENGESFVKINSKHHISKHHIARKRENNKLSNFKMKTN